MPDPDTPEEWTDERRRALRPALRARRERLVRGGQVVGLALVVIVAAAVLLRLPEAWWVPAVGAVALGGLVFRMANWKCPACGERLPTRGSSMCRGCGLPLDE
jgi:hypothetical protein